VGSAPADLEKGRGVPRTREREKTIGDLSLKEKNSETNATRTFEYMQFLSVSHK
jgi:hypothetical protein